VRAEEDQVPIEVNHAGPEDVCHCGQPARVVIVTNAWGPVPFCGLGWSDDALEVSEKPAGAQ
jgi:hypothetical protein